MVLFVYVDNSNVWIEGQRVSAVRKGMARSAWEAMEQDVLDREWQYDFGRLYELACPDEAVVGRSILFGSRPPPPPNDSRRSRARREGFEQVLVEDWRTDYNHRRPHSALGMMAPARFAASWRRSEEQIKRLSLGVDR